jgi:hypothetical protein
MTRPVNAIAREIAADWRPVNFAAKPYLDAMRELNSVADKYYYDEGVSIVAYFLANASAWRGDTARRVKAELRAMIAKA